MKSVEDLTHSSYEQNSGFGFPTQTESMGIKRDLTIYAVVIILLTAVSFGCGHADARSVPLQVGNKIIINIFILSRCFCFCSVTLPLKSKTWSLFWVSSILCDTESASPHIIARENILGISVPVECYFILKILFIYL